MTRLELITRALRVVGNTSLTSEAEDWVDDILLEFEAIDLWRFLETSTTYQTENTVDNIAFSATKWPSAAITDYSKGLFVSSAIDPYGLKYVPQVEFKKIHTNETGVPRIFSFWNDTLWLHPTPVTNFLPLLTVYYYQQITLPTAGSDELSDSTKTGMPKKLHPILMKGVIARGMTEEKDLRADAWQIIYEKAIALIALQDNGDYPTDAKEMFSRIGFPARSNKTVESIK